MVRKILQSINLNNLNWRTRNITISFNSVMLLLYFIIYESLNTVVDLIKLKSKLSRTDLNKACSHQYHCENRNSPIINLSVVGKLT